MLVYFLGTGPSRPIPRIGCFCRVCKSARSKNSKSRRIRSAILAEDRGKRLLFNAPPEICGQLDEARKRGVNYVFISHKHKDAYGGVPAIRRCKPGFKLYSEPENLRHGLAVDAGGTKITAFRVQHSMTSGFPTLGFRIGRNLAYVSDAGGIPKKSEKFLRGVSHLILDASMWFGKQIKSHFTVDKAIITAHRLGARRVYLQQISHTYPPHEEAERHIRNFCRKNKIKSKVMLAYDGMKIRI